MPETNAQIYANHRPRYPRQLIEDLCSRAIDDGAGLLIDWGCGTGELTLPLSPRFDRVVAVDIGEDRISLGREIAEEKGIENVEWHVCKAEELEIEPESCDLITSASAFHWMDRELLAKRAFQGLKPDGTMALVGGAGTNIWRGAIEWHQVAVECLAKYIDPPAGDEPQDGGKAAKKRRWHAEFLTEAGFEVEHRKHPTEFSLPVDEVAGYLYSITGGLPWHLGDGRAAFEREFSDALAARNPSGFILETIDFFLLIGNKP